MIKKSLEENHATKKSRNIIGDTEEWKELDGTHSDVVRTIINQSSVFLNRNPIPHIVGFLCECLWWTKVSRHRQGGGAERRIWANHQDGIDSVKSASHTLKDERMGFSGVPPPWRCRVERTAIEDKKYRLRKPYAIAMFTKNIFKFFQNAFSGMFIFIHRELLEVLQNNRNTV